MTEAAITPDTTGPMFEADGEPEVQVDATRAGTRVDKETERAELIKAADEAAAKALEKDAEPKPDPKTKKATKEPAKADAPAKGEGEEETKGSKLAKILEQREKATGVIAEADKKHQAASGLYEQAQAVLREAQQAKAAADAELAEMKRLRADPYAALQKLGWTPDDIIEAATRNKDPNFQAQMKYDQELAKRDDLISKLSSRLEKIEGVAKSYEEQGTTAAQQQAVTQLFAAIPEDSPARKMWDDDFIVAKAIRVQQEVKAKANRVASPTEIAEYLHYEAVKKLNALVTPEKATGSSSAGKAKANGSRAPAPRIREASPKPDHLKSPAEIRAELIAAVDGQIAEGD